MPNPSAPPAGPMMSDNGFPRRIRVDLFTEAERAIYDAHVKVEAVGAHDRLTDAVNLLSKAHEAVADGVEALGLTTPAAALPPFADAPSELTEEAIAREYDAVMRADFEAKGLNDAGGMISCLEFARIAPTAQRAAIAFARRIAALRPSADAAPPTELSEDEFLRAATDESEAVRRIVDRLRAAEALRYTPDLSLQYIVQETRRLSCPDAAPVTSGETTDEKIAKVAAKVVRRWNWMERHGEAHAMDLALVRAGMDLADSESGRQS